MAKDISDKVIIETIILKLVRIKRETINSNKSNKSINTLKAVVIFIIYNLADSRFRIISKKQS